MQKKKKICEDHSNPPRILPFNALCGLFIISTVPLQEWLIYAIFQWCFCRYFSEYSDKCRFRHSFLPCSYFVHKFCLGLNLMNPHPFQNPGSPAIFACIFSPKHPDKSSSRLPAVETAYMRSAGIHAGRCLSIFPLPILQRIPEHGNTALSFAVFNPHFFQSVFQPAFLLLSRCPPALSVFSKSFSLLSLQAFPFPFSS